MTALAAGDAFLCPEDWEGGRHLWIVISNPSAAEDVLIVNVSKLKGLACDDRTCVLEADSHPRINVRSCIRYDRCKKVAVKALENVLGNEGRFTRQAPVAGEVLLRIQRASSTAPMIDPIFRALMRKQGLAL